MSVASDRSGKDERLVKIEDNDGPRAATKLRNEVREDGKGTTLIQGI
jgi:hypothetical protein